MDTAKLSNLERMLPTAVLHQLYDTTPDDSSFDYINPPRCYESRKQGQYIMPKTRKSFTHIPSRLSAPLYPFPQEILHYIETGEITKLTQIQKIYHPDIINLRQEYLNLSSMIGLSGKSFKVNIENLLPLSKLKYSSKAGFYSNIAHSIAKKFVIKDLGIIAKIDSEGYKMDQPYNKIPSFLYIIQKHRMTLTLAEKSSDKISDIINGEYGDSTSTRLSTGCYLLYGKGNDYTYNIILSSNFFILHHSDSPDLFLGDMEHFELMITMAEVYHTLMILSVATEYTALRNILNLLLMLLDSKGKYSALVNIMKVFESICLMRADIIDSTCVSWAPIIEMLEIYCKYAYEYDGTQLNKMEMILLFLGKPVYFNQSNILAHIIYEIGKLDGPQSLEASTLHKCCCYAEIDEASGIEKYIRREYTPRPYDSGAIREMVCLAKREFTMSFIAKHRVLPNLISPIDKINLIAMYYKDGHAKSLEILELGWWEDLVFGKTLCDVICQDPLEYAKDKGAIKHDISHGYGDSVQELTDVLTRPEYNIQEINFKEFEDTIEPTITIGSQLDEEIYVKLPTRLIMKEKEQKSEGRLFGCANIDLKHSLSQVMNKCKLALSYFSGEFMTIADKKRKLILHDAAQLLLLPDHYSILLDIEGHNQSMQYGNLSPLAEFIGSLFGNPDWKYIPNLFNHLHVYYYEHYYDKTTVMTGQLGGIEGWCNPLWTLHTLLVSKLFTIKSNIEVPLEMVYSDDVNLIVKLLSTDQLYITELYTKLIRHFKLYGMIVKPSQTMLSKNRVTMLRNHYYKGIKTDSSLKRLLAVTQFNEQEFICDELEVQGISSAVSSALEMGEHIRICLYMKWYKVILMTIRSFCTYLNHSPEDLIIDMEYMPSLYKEIIRPKYQEVIRLVGNNFDELNMIIKESIIEKQEEHALSIVSINAVEELLTSIGQHPHTTNILNFPELIMPTIIDNEYLLHIYFFGLVLPQRYGGLNTDLGINSLLSGHSSGLLKTLEYARSSIPKGKLYTNSLHKIIMNVLNDRGGELTERKLGVLAQDEYPVGRNALSCTTIINSRIKRFVKGICNNKHIISLFNIEEYKADFREELVNLTKDNLTARIVKFYYENSVFHILDKLLTKVETSRTFVKKSQLGKTLRRKLFEQNVNHWKYMLLKDKSVDNKIIYDNDSSTYEIMYNLRKALYNEVRFYQYSEPLYEFISDYAIGPNNLLTSFVSSGKTTKYDIDVYLGPQFGNEVLYKGESLDELIQFETIEAAIIFKLGQMTKWILYKSSEFAALGTVPVDCNIVKMCNLSLSTISDIEYNDIKLLFQLPKGGEILHRLNTYSFRTKSFIRSFPLSINKNRIFLNQRRFTEDELIDTNLNIDYLTFRWQLAICVKQLYFPCRKLSYSVRLKPDMSLGKVQSDFTCSTNYTSHFSIKTMRYLPKESLPITNFRYMSTILSNNDDDESSPILIADNLITDVTERPFNYFIYDIYHNLGTLTEQRQYLYLEEGDMSAWLPFVTKYRHVYEELSLLNDTEIINIIKDILFNDVPKMFIDSRTTDKTISTTIITSELREHLGITFDNYSEYLTMEIKYFIKVRRNFRKRISVTLRARLKHLKEHVKAIQSKLFRNMALDIIIKYTLSYGRDYGHLYIDKEGSIARTQDFIFTRLLSNVEDPTLSLLTELIDIESLYIYVQRNVINLINDVIQAATKIDLYEILPDIQVSNIPPKIIKVCDVNIPARALSVNYTSVNVDVGFLEHINEVYSQMVWIHSIVEIYGNAYSLYSPTGSDSFTAQYGLFQYLIHEDNNFRDKFITDITAGRGDGHLALNLLGINHISLSEKSNFTKLKHMDGIHIIDYYNISVPETFAKYIDNSVVHIDVSHLSDSNKDLTNTISFLIYEHTEFIIRLNSIKFDGQSLLKNLLIYGGKLRLLYPISETIKPYQMYLHYQPGPIQPIIHTENLSSSVTYQHLIRNYTMLIRWRNLFLPPDADLTNSATILISENITVQDIIANRIIDYTDDELLNNLTTYQTYCVYKDDIPIVLANVKPQNSDIINNILQSMKHGCNATLEGLQFKSKFRQGTESHRTKAMFAHYKHIMNLGKENDIIRLCDLTSETLEYLNYTHPILEIRLLIHSFIELMQIYSHEQIDDKGFIEQELTTRRHVIGADKGLYSKNFKIALQHHAFSAIAGNYDEGLKIMWLRLQDPGGNRRQLFTQIKIYRKLGGLYQKFKGQLNGDVSERKWYTSMKLLYTTNLLKICTREGLAIDYENKDILGDKFAEQVFDNFKEFVTKISDNPREFIPIPVIPVGDIFKTEDNNPVSFGGLISSILNEALSGLDMEELLNSYERPIGIDYGDAEDDERQNELDWLEYERYQDSLKETHGAEESEE